MGVGGGVLYVISSQSIYFVSACYIVVRRVEEFKSLHDVGQGSVPLLTQF